jgi:hypothetical protein
MDCRLHRPVTRQMHGHMLTGAVRLCWKTPSQRLLEQTPSAARHLSWRLVTLAEGPATQMPGLSDSQPLTVLRLGFRPTSSSTLLQQQGILCSSTS